MPEFMTIREVGRVLRISTQRVKKYIRSGELPALKFSDGEVRINADVLKGLREIPLVEPKQDDVDCHL